MLKDWIKGEPDEDQYEIPDVEGCIPACIKERPLSRRKLREVRAQLGTTQAGHLIDAVLDLADISGQAKRPELTEQMREELGDTNPPLPSLLAVFVEGDAVEGSFVTLSRESENLRWVCCEWGWWAADERRA